MGNAPQLDAEPTLVTAWFCPFAQRTWIALNEKNIPHHVFEVTHHDLYNKPEWFLQLNPIGHIPIIAYKKETGDVVTVVESLICNEYLEDAYPELALLPRSAYDKAQARLVVDRFANKFVPEFYKILVRQDKGQQADSARALAGELAWLAGVLRNSGGPYILGQQFSLADAAIFPFIFRLFILRHYRGFQAPAETQGVLDSYLAAAKERPAVKGTMVHHEGLNYEEELIKSYARYADASAPSTMAKEAK